MKPAWEIASFTKRNEVRQRSSARDCRHNRIKEQSQRQLKAGKDATAIKDSWLRDHTYLVGSVVDVDHSLLRIDYPNESHSSP
jgi:hypothetical protein